MSEHYTTARITRVGEVFEIIVKPQPSLSYRLGKTQSVSQVLVTDTIYTDAGKGLRASEEKLRKSFGTTDSLKIASVILRKGTLQLTTEQRKKLVENKRKQIVSFISRQSLDPRTNLPHPPKRIEQAMEQIHFSIDPFGDVGDQAREIVKLMRPIIPLKMELLSIVVRIPPEYASKAYGAVKTFGAIKREEWRSNGSWVAKLELPAGLYGPLLEKLGEVTRGNVETQLVK